MQELKAQRAAKAREEAEAGAAAAAAAAAAADEPASDSEETKKKLEEEERIKQVTRVLFDAVQNNKYKKVDELLSSVRTRVMAERAWNTCKRLCTRAWMST